MPAPACLRQGSLSEASITTHEQQVSSIQQRTPNILFGIFTTNIPFSAFYFLAFDLCPLSFVPRETSPPVNLYPLKHSYGISITTNTLLSATPGLTLHHYWYRTESAQHGLRQRNLFQQPFPLQPAQQSCQQTGPINCSVMELSKPNRSPRANANHLPLTNNHFSIQWPPIQFVLRPHLNKNSIYPHSKLKTNSSKLPPIVPRETIFYKKHFLIWQNYRVSGKNPEILL